VTSATRGPVTVLDLLYRGQGTVGAFLVRTSAGPALVETGPESLHGNLKAAVEAQGFALEDVRDVFLTHIHLDHGGAAWRLARHGARIHVHPAGAAHLLDPARLMRSARRVYGDDLDRLWGLMEPIAAGLVVPVADGERVRLGDTVLEALHTPGHANHHITWRLGDGLFTGDVGGIRLGTGPVIPPFPPPDIDLELWLGAIARMRAAAPACIFPTHFGIKEDAAFHLASLEENLHLLAGWVRERLQAGLEEDALVPPFQAFLRDLLLGHGLGEEAVRAYEIADPAYMSVYGLGRYWRARADFKGGAEERSGPG